MSETSVRPHLRYILLIAALACSTAAVACEPDASFIMESGVAMNRMMTEMGVAPTGDVDADFTAMMVPHHQGAIDMAVAYLRYGKNERLRRLAQEIIITQSDEIAVMRLVVDPPLAQASSRVPSQSSTMPQAAMCPLESSSTVHGSMHDHRNP
jgi:hypothetical protein